MDLMPELGQKQERPGVRPEFKEEEETQPQSDEEQWLRGLPSVGPTLHTHCARSFREI